MHCANYVTGPAPIRYPANHGGYRNLVRDGTTRHALVVLRIVIALDKRVATWLRAVIGYQQIAVSLHR